VFLCPGGTGKENKGAIQSEKREKEFREKKKGASPSIRAKGGKKKKMKGHLMRGEIDPPRQGKKIDYP